jgi:hypothetical protein
LTAPPTSRPASSPVRPAEVAGTKVRYHYLNHIE